MSEENNTPIFNDPLTEKDLQYILDNPNTPILDDPLTEEDLQYILDNPATKEIFNKIQEFLFKAFGVPSDKVDSVKEGFIDYIRELNS